MSSVYFDLSLGSFTQNWSTVTLATNNDWSSVPSIMGYLGSDITAVTAADPRTLLGDGTVVVSLIVNQTAPNSFTTGGAAYFSGANVANNPVVALNGTGTADAPSLVLFLNATGRENVTVNYLLRDLDGSTDNSIQPVALQYRLGNSGAWTNVPAGYVADASGGPSTATQTNVVTAVLPAVVNGQAEVQVRIITANAAGNDEWIGIDDIVVSSSALVATPGVTIVESGGATAVSEGGATDSYTVVLNAQPTADVTVALAPNAQVSTSPTSLTFTSANWNVAQTVTVTAVDDSVVEGAHTGSISHSVTSADTGYDAIAVVAVTSTIADNDASGTLAYAAPTLSEARSFDGAVSGKTVITLTGDTFTGTNGDNLLVASKATAGNVPVGLTAVLVQTSATTAELNYTGSATSHAVDVGNVSLTFANSAFTGGIASAVTGSNKTDLGINFASVGTAGSVQSFTPNAGTTQDSSDASTALALDANWMVVGDDEANVLRVISREGGAAVLEWSYATNGPLLAGGELDLEASTRIGDTLYFLGSHSNSRTGTEANNREFIFSVTVAGTGANTVFTYGGQFAGLEAALATWDSSNAHSRGANYFGFTASAAAGAVPEAVNGFSMEGLTASQDGTQLFLAFRAPQSPTSIRDKAVIVPVAVAGLIGGTTPTIGTPIELNLGGRGIRSIEKSADGSGYLILAGPAGAASTDVTHDFRLFRWDGASANPTEINVNLDTLLSITGGSFETIVDVLNTSSGTMVQLLQDNGDTIWPGQSVVSKDLAANLQKYEGTWVQLGADVADSVGPALANTTPADNASGISVAANLVLRFDEGVKAGGGNFVIRKGSDGSVVESMAATSANVAVSFNTVTLNPSVDLLSSTDYYLEADSTALTDAAGNAWAGLSGASAFNFTTAAAPTILSAGDVLFMAANADATDGFSFVLTKAITASTQIGLTDRDYSLTTGMPVSGESAYIWTADQAYPVGTIVTVRPDVAPANPAVDKGSIQGAGGGMSATAETIYAFQGSIAGLGTNAAGAVTVDRFLASINVGGASAGAIPAELTTAGASISFAQDNAIYQGPLDRADLAAFVASIKNTSNYATSDTVASLLVNNSFFGGPIFSSGAVNGTALTLTFFDALGSTLPAVGAFAVKVNGIAVSIPTAISASGNTVTLTLASPVTSSNSVTVSYTDPTTGNDANALQNTSGDDSFSFTDKALVNNTPVPSVGTNLLTPYLETFNFSLADFASISVDADGVNKWFWKNSAPTSATVNGFGDTAPANDWLISKGFDLTQTSVEFLSFTTWTAFSDAGIPTPQVKLKYSTNYTGSGSPMAATWTDLAYTPSADNSSVVTPSGSIDLSAIAGNNVFFAFQYTSSGTGSSTSSDWRLDDFSLQGFAGPVLTIVATDAAKPEGNTGSTPYTFTVTRLGDSTGTATVDYAVTGAAVDVSDFGGSLPTGTVSFAANESSKVITINVSGDMVNEVAEAFTVTLSNPTGASLTSAPSATGAIQADDVPPTKISAVQGTGTTAAMNGQTVYVEGVVTAVMPGLKGFYIQEEAADYDADSSTSEGLFVYYGNTALAGLNANSVGDVVRVGGVVAEYQSQTQLQTPNLFVVVTDNADASALPAPVAITLPVAAAVDWERVEGMLVQISSATAAGAGGKLVITDNFSLGQYGQVTLTSDAVISNFTETNVPSSSGYTTFKSTVQRDQIILDDGSSATYGDVPGRAGNALSASNTLRAGDSVVSVTGVVDQFGALGSTSDETTYRIQPTNTVAFTGDARPTASSLPTQVTSAEIKVASVNVLNYFTALADGNNSSTEFTNPNGTAHSSRGADSATEFAHQRDKLVANLLGLNADVVGLMEMQNNGFGNGTSGIDSLVDALNLVAGAGTYAYVAGPYKDGNGADSVTAGDDAIMGGILYKPGKVALVGQAAVPDVALGAYSAFTAAGGGSRVPLAQTFRSLSDDEVFTLVVNHFKSKGSGTGANADQNDGAGASNAARLLAAEQLLAWLATNPTGNADTDVLLVGDFNAYSKEAPITYLDNNGFDKVSTGLSYAFNGQWGSLDHAIASDSLVSQVAGAVKWGINAEEPTALDYNLENKSVGQQAAYYAADAYRSSDHNPVLIGLNLDSAAVNLSVSSASGSEAGTSVITVTATASRPVVGNQSVALGVSGTNITAGDYVLSANSISIAAGATTGTVTFTVTNDVENEDAEVAVLTLGSPSSGVRLGATTALNITIADNDVPVVEPVVVPVAPSVVLAVVGTPTQGQTLTAQATLSNGGSLGTAVYQWTASGVDVAGVSGPSLLLTQGLVGKVISVVASYTNTLGVAATVGSAATEAVANVNDPYTGGITIVGSLIEGQLLTLVSTLADADGLGQLNLQWYADGTAITGANTASLVLTKNEVGALIRATVGYVDAFGSIEVAITGSSGLVTALPVPPTVLQFSPADEATGVAVAQNIVFTFSEPVVPGSGSIVLTKSDGSTIETFIVGNSSNINIAGNTLTLNPSADLAFASSYRVELGAGVVKDLTGLGFAGSSSYNFSTLGQVVVPVEPVKPVDLNLTGTAANDRFVSGAGNDAFDGAGGIDTTAFAGVRANYQIQGSVGNFTVTDTTSTQGKDVLKGVERLQFLDVGLAFDLMSGGNAGRAAELIGVLAPSQIGNAALVGEILGVFDQGFSMAVAFQMAIDRGLVTGLAGGSSNTAVAVLAYKSLTGVVPDATVVDWLLGYFDGRLASFSQAEFLASVAVLDLNDTNIGLVGLQQTGLQYL